MKKNNTVETAQKGQTTTNIQPEKVVKSLQRIDDIRKNKNNSPTGKVVSLKETEERKKAREQEYRNFRIAALRRRAKRMKLSEEETNNLVEKLKKQLDEPATYQILVMFNKTQSSFVKEALKNAKINATVIGDVYTWIDGGKDLLDKLREILPTGVKIHPYTKKKPPVLEKKIPDKEKKPTVNTAGRKKAAKAARKAINMMKVVSRKKTRGKAAAKQQKRKTLLELKQKRLNEKKGTTVSMVNKKPSETLTKTSRPKRKLKDAA